MKMTTEQMQRYETEMLKEVHTICQRNDIDYFMAYGSALGAVRHEGPIPWDSDADIAVPYNQLKTFISTVRKELPDKFYLDYHDKNEFYPLLFPRIGLSGYSTRRLHVDIYLLVGGPSDPSKKSRFKKKAGLYNKIFMIKNANKKFYGYETTLKRKIFFPPLKTLLFFIPNQLFIKIFERHCEKYPYAEAKFVVNANGGYGMKEVHSKSFYGEGKVVEYADIKVKIPEKYEAYLRHFYGDYMQLPPEEEMITQARYEVIEK